ncbi:MAG: NADH-quinone oxidoreductase subunit N [Ignavibacteriaceae bacterium]|nr:NADH-quinone oxidoreductase subunit N [Ignavibacteriaceae bacterium]
MFDSIQFLKPEITVSLFLVILVTVDLILGKKNKQILPYISLAGLLITGFFVIQQFETSAFASVQNNIGNFGLIAVDSFGNYFKLIIILSSIFIILFSISSIEIKQAFDRHGEYYSLIFGMILGMMLMVSSVDLILIYLSIELVSLSSYVLAGFTKHSLRNSEASLKYIIYGSAASGIMLFGISILYGIMGTTNIYAINTVLQNGAFQPLALIISCILIFTGFGFKISAAPFHFWTPDVYEGAPIAITAYLSIASKAAGFALLIRFIKITFIQAIGSDGYWQLLEVIDWKSFLIIISIGTMTLGNFAALWQDNLKRMLAYSSIAHAGYMILGLAVFSDQGIMAILIYFMVYLFMNLGAFFVVMLIANRIGSEEIDDYDGLGYKTPLLAVSLGVFLVSLTGLPPTAGFIGKLYLFIALVDAKMIVVAIIALLNTVVSLYYYVRVLKHMFLAKPKSEEGKIAIGYADTVVLMALLIPVFVFGLYFTPIVNLAKNSIALLGF